MADRCGLLIGRRGNARRTSASSGRTGARADVIIADHFPIENALVRRRDINGRIACCSSSPAVQRGGDAPAFLAEQYLNQWDVPVRTRSNRDADVRGNSRVFLF
jgi:hypothetical protein